MCNRLSQNTIDIVKNALNQRTLEPMRNTFRGINMGWQHAKWMSGDGNWNVVCWQGVLLTALTQISDQRERDLFVSQAMTNTMFFFNAFQEDGYYTESSSPQRIESLIYFN